MRAASLPLPSDLAARTWERYKDNREHLGVVAWCAVAFAAWQLWPIVPPAAVLVATAVAGLAAWERYQAGQPWRARAATAVGVSNGAGLLAFTGQGLLAVALAVAAWQLTLRPEQTAGALRAEDWTEKFRLAAAYVTAGILRKTGDQLPVVHVGRPRVDEYGKTVTVDLPPGTSIGDVQKRHPALASAIKVPARRLHLDHDPDAPANKIEMTVLTADRPEVPPDTVDGPVDYDAPLLVGTDPLGRPVTRRTWGCHALYIGTTGSGKTMLARRDVARGLAAGVPTFLIDYKDDRTGGWREMHPLCEMVAAGEGEETCRRALEVLRAVDRLSAQRREGGTETGVNVVIDEWYALLVMARSVDKELADDLEGLMTRLLATARSRRIKLHLLLQRGTDEYVSTHMRINAVQRYVGLTENRAEVRYVLDDDVPLVLPRDTGEFVVKDVKQKAVTVAAPLLDDEAWAGLCARLLADRAEHPCVSLVKTAPVPIDPLEQAVLGALALGPMTPTALWESLPVLVRPGSQTALAARLKQLPGVERGHVGSQRAWRLGPVGRASAARRTDGLEGLLHAQTRSVGPDLSDLSVSA